MDDRKLLEFIVWIIENAKGNCKKQMMQLHSVMKEQGCGQEQLWLVSHVLEEEGAFLSAYRKDSNISLDRARRVVSEAIDERSRRRREMEMDRERYGRC